MMMHGLANFKLLDVFTKLQKAVSIAMFVYCPHGPVRLTLDRLP